MDGLKMELAQTKDDTTEIRLLIESSVRQHLVNPEQAHSLVQDAKKQVQKLSTLNEKAQGLQLIGIGYYHLKQLDSAVFYFEQAERQVLQMTDSYQSAEAFYRLGLNYDKYDYLTPALQVFEQALGIYQKLEAKEKEIILQEKLALLYEKIRDYPKALSFLRNSLKIREQMGDQLLLAGTLNKIGQNLEQQQSYEYALPYFFRSKSIYQRMDDKPALSYLYLHIGSVHGQLGHLDSAHFYLQESLFLAKQFNDGLIHTLCLSELGRLLEKSGAVTTAIVTLKKAFGEATKQGLIQEKIKISQMLYRLFKQQNNSQESLFYHEIYQSIKDSITAVEHEKNLLRLEADYEFEKELQLFGHGEEKEAKRKSEELRQSRLIRFVMAVMLSFTLIILLIVYRYYQLKQDSNKMLMRLNKKVIYQKNVLTIQNKQLTELDQMKSHFFTNISHEFRTPLTVIDGMVQQIKKAPEKWTKKGLQMIERSNSHLLQLINQILDLRKLESGKLKLNLVRNDVVSYIREVFESFESLGENKGVKLHFLCQEKELLMDYDAEKLLRVLSNLLSNAIKFTPAGGDVYLIVSKGISDLQRHDVFEDSNQLEIKIRDTGIGIPSNKLPFIFDRFYQVDDGQGQEVEGTGIGLALSRELVKVMNGSIQVFSEPERGTTFKLVIPGKGKSAFSNNISTMKPSELY